ncbi:uncharacterized protein C11orf52 homolog isoform X1 [Diceros bicornis minor]|uniref:uncharacterized protein C11orf52 homolog isoform X1 n=1 Tax=Diceros bicornis minor TaxID=77932 RepID=UPI0026EA6CF4|nr:uncharacterized protein C11orf52 homolog isoform X1 [Diceros bicornis minor]
MGNRLCCGGSWSCPSTFQRKKKMGSQGRRTLKQHQQQIGTKVMTGLGPLQRAAHTWDPRTQLVHPGTDTSQLSVELADSAHPPLPPKGAKRRDLSVTDPALEVRGKTKPRTSLNALPSSQGHDTTGHTSKRVLGQPASQERSQGLRSEESSLHYADIQVCSRTQPRSAREVKHLQLENATEYATLRFPQATPRYDSKNGTLV